MAERTRKMRGAEGAPLSAPRNGGFPAWGRRWGREALALVYPPTCAGYDIPCAANEDISAACRAALPWIRGRPQCPVCGLPYESEHADVLPCGTCRTTAPRFTIARAAALHEPPIVRIIHQYKYERRRRLAATLGDILWEGVRDRLGDTPWDTVVPAPLHPKRLRQRGFDQAYLLAQVISSLSAIPVESRLLTRVRHTLPQVRLTEHERAANVRGAFACTAMSTTNTKPLTGRRVLVVDDVYTTGATMRECAKVLTRAGAEAVGAITITRAI